MQVEIRDLRKTFGGRTCALDGVSFGVGQGEFVSVIGPSGAGKSTLFGILNGSLRCGGGSVLFDGVPFERARGRRKRAVQKRIGTVYQDFCLVEQTSCLENILDACLPDMNVFQGSLGLFGRARRERAMALLDRVGLKDKADSPVCELSGGQKQRVAVARALMRRPGLLLADEPSASLDPVTGRQILELLHTVWQSEGLTVLMNSHNLEFALRYSQRLIGLRAGRVVFDGTPAEATEAVLADIYGGAVPRGQEPADVRQADAPAAAGTKGGDT